MALPSISALPAAPSRSDPANFNAESEAFAAALPTFRAELNAFRAAANASNLIEGLQETWTATLTDASGNTSATTAPGYTLQFGRFRQYVVQNMGAVSSAGMAAGDEVRLVLPDSFLAIGGITFVRSAGVCNWYLLATLPTGTGALYPQWSQGQGYCAFRRQGGTAGFGTLRWSDIDSGVSQLIDLNIYAWIIP
jgi:hypothetical protein